MVLGSVGLDERGDGRARVVRDDGMNWWWSLRSCSVLLGISWKRDRDLPTATWNPNPLHIGVDRPNDDENNSIDERLS